MDWLPDGTVGPTLQSQNRGQVTLEGISLLEWTVPLWDSSSREKLAASAAQGVLYIALAEAFLGINNHPSPLEPLTEAGLLCQSRLAGHTALS